MPDVGALIVAGGAGTRLGGALKPLLVVNGRTILERQLEVLRPLVSEILLSTNTPGPFARFGLPLVADETVEACPAGPLAGLAAGLFRLESPRAIVVAGDMPFLHPGFLQLLLSMGPRARAVVPLDRTARPQPLHAVYDRDVAAVARDLLREGKHRMSDLLDRVTTEWVAPSRYDHLEGAHDSFFNVNEPADLDRGESP